jgi:hypothetical protein
MNRYKMTKNSRSWAWKIAGGAMMVAAGYLFGLALVGYVGR